jgi:hypothetical protein
MSILKIRDDEINEWVKNPGNIYVGNTPTYSNVFSLFESNYINIVTSSAINNFSTLAGKTLGYTTDDQRHFAEVLAKMGSDKCSEMIYNHLESIKPNITFESTSNRIWLATLIRHQLEDLSRLPVGEQCLNAPRVLNKIDLGKKIGAGSFGNIYVAHVNKRYIIALKMAIAGVTETAIKNPYDQKYTAWNEINILKPYINSFIEKGICQNFPYVYNSFICRHCDFEREVKDKLIIKRKPCYIVVEEIASGDLRRWGNIGRRTEEEKYNALFQCMAGLHALQKYFQICNNDIKGENILFKEISIIENSYWEYVIMGTTYYIPNTGSLFFVNDFGVSYSSDPTLPICRRLSKNDRPVEKVKNAGYRPFIVVNGKLTPVRYNNYFVDGAVSDLKVVYKKEKYIFPSIYLPRKIEAVLTDEQKSVMKEHDPNFPSFYSDSNIIPFFDSYIDTQDMIRTFIGGERVTQPGQHPGIAPEFSGTMNKYQLKDRNLRRIWINMEDTKLTPSMLLAGYFIDTYFKTDMKRFLIKPVGGILLQKFVI